MFSSKPPRPAMVLLGIACLTLSCSANDPVSATAEHGQAAVMHGMYSYMADAAVFTDCRTGKSFPVAFEGDNLALETAYLKTPHQPGEALPVKLQARIEQRAPMEGPGPVPTLIPERFLSISTEGGCDRVEH